MPELPEVETVMRGLMPAMDGEVIAFVDVRRPDLRWPLPVDLAERLTGAQVVALSRRSKYILVTLDTGDTLLLHLGMSGRIVIHAGSYPKIPGAFTHTWPALEKHDHVVFDIAQGARIVFNDPRRFGMIDLVATDDLAQHRMLKSLGPEPLGNAFHADMLTEAFGGRVSPVKALLLDQRIVAGLGNIYVCEALWRSGIAPTRAGGRIAAKRVAILVTAIRDVLREAIEAGGSSLRDYRQTNGDLGYFQHRFSVYGREGQSCTRKGCAGIIRRVVQSSRSSFYCPVCQT